MRIPKEDYGKIESDFNDKLVPVIDIAGRYGVTRQAIYKILRSMGVDTSKRKVQVECTYCGGSFYRVKSQLRGRRFVFCCMGCYYAWVNAQRGKYRPDRRGQRLARGAVDAVFPLMPGYVVHHIDGDNKNNDLRNLMVFASNADHVSYHRRGGGRPLWDGRSQ